MFKGIVYPASKKCMDETLFQHRNCFFTAGIPQHQVSRNGSAAFACTDLLSIQCKRRLSFRFISLFQEIVIVEAISFRLVFKFIASS